MIPAVYPPPRTLVPHLPPSTAQDVLTPAGMAVISGPLGERLQRCIANGVARQNLEEVINPFIERTDVQEWRGEFWGKWITSAIAACRYTGDPALRAIVDEAVARLLATQTPDGYIGAFAEENRLQRWDVWSRKYVLLGLLDYHDLTGDATVLAACVRLADHLIAETRPGTGNPFRNDRWHGMASSSVIEPMVRLYRATGDARYLEHMRYFIGWWEDPSLCDLLRKAEAGMEVFDMLPGASEERPTIFRDAGYGKAYEMMSCYEGLLELFRDTGEPRYRDAALHVWDSVARTEVTLLGGASDWERWISGRHQQSTRDWWHGMETCVTVYWMKLSAQLLTLTGDAKYADAFERSYFNALLASLRPDGAWWTHYVTFEGVREPAEECFGMHQQCCVANGPRALLWLPGLAVMQRADGLAVNFYAPLTVTARLTDDFAVRIEQRTRYPEEGTVTILVEPERPRAFPLSVRIPAWSRAATVRVNGENLAGVNAADYVTITREWTAGDRIELDLKIEARLEPAPGDPDHAALAWGPIILARDARLGLDAPAVISDPLSPSPIAPPADVWMAFEGDGLRVVDYASAGNTWDERSRFSVWLPTR